MPAIAAPALATLLALTAAPATTHAHGRAAGARAAPPAAPAATAFAARTTTFERGVRVLINTQRRRLGLRPLHAETRLARAARAHSRDMVRRRYFSHTTPGGVGFATRIAATGYGRGGRWSAGETIAAAGRGRDTPAGIVALWLASPPHRAILLDPSFEDVGVGVAPRTPDGGRGITVTADFGARG